MGFGERAPAGASTTSLRFDNLGLMLMPTLWNRCVPRGRAVHPFPLPERSSFRSPSGIQILAQTRDPTPSTRPRLKYALGGAEKLSTEGVARVFTALWPAHKKGHNPRTARQQHVDKMQLFVICLLVATTAAFTMFGPHIRIVPGQKLTSDL